jgi:hypothetical protein
LEITNRKMLFGQWKPIWDYFWCVNSLWSSFGQMYYDGLRLKIK